MEMVEKEDLQMLRNCNYKELYTTLLNVYVAQQVP